MPEISTDLESDTLQHLGCVPHKIAAHILGSAKTHSLLAKALLAEAQGHCLGNGVHLLRIHLHAPLFKLLCNSSVK